MSPVLNHFKGSSLRMPGTSLDNANVGRLARPLASLRGGAGRPRAGPTDQRRCYPNNRYLYSQGRFYLLLAGLRQNPSDTSNLSPETSRAKRERRIGSLGDSTEGRCPGPSKLLRTSLAEREGDKWKVAGQALNPAQLCDPLSLLSRSPAPGTDRQQHRLFIPQPSSLSYKTTPAEILYT